MIAGLERVRNSCSDLQKFHHRYRIYPTIGAIGAIFSFLSIVERERERERKKKKKKKMKKKKKGKRKNSTVRSVGPRKSAKEIGEETGDESAIAPRERHGVVARSPIRSRAISRSPIVLGCSATKHQAVGTRARGALPRRQQLIEQRHREATGPSSIVTASFAELVSRGTAAYMFARGCALTVNKVTCGTVI